MKKFRFLCGLLFCILMMTGVPASAAGYVSEEGIQSTESSSVKKVQVTYLNNKGNSTAAYAKKIKTVKKGSYITLPSLPAVNGYQAKGWTNVKNGKTAKYKENSRLKVTGNLKLYAVYAAEPVITLHKQDGSVLKKITAVNGRRRLPSMANQTGYTFLGWSKRPGQTVNPDYKAGEVVTLTRNMHLYAVVFDRSTEPDIKAAKMDKPDPQKYKKVIFVGDSRTYLMKNTMTSQFDDSVTENVSFVCQSGAGLHWLKNTGTPKILSELKKAGTKGKPVAVIFNFGVNDLRYEDGRDMDVNDVLSRYVSYMKQLAATLKSKNCKLFYMSVNPINSSMSKYKGRRKEEDLQAFNQGIKTKLKGTYQYLDSYSYLYKEGYGTQSFWNPNLDDGVHYTAQTYKRIYRYCIKRINKL